MHHMHTQTMLPPLAIMPLPGRSHKMHRLKTLTHFYDAVLAGFKTFEVRFNDRDFRIGDFLLLIDYHPDGDNYGREMFKQVTYIFTGGAQPSTNRAEVENVVTEGWVVMGLAPVPEWKQKELYETIEVFNSHPVCLRIGDLWETTQGPDSDSAWWITEIAADRQSIKIERQSGEKAGEERWVSVDMISPATGWEHKKRGGWNG